MTSKPKDKSAADPVETLASVGKEAFEAALSMGVQAAAEGYQNAAQFGKEQLEANKAGYDKAVVLGKGNLEAYSAASAAAVSGFEAYYEEIVDYTKKAVAQNVELMQKVYAAKTPQEMLDLQLQAVNSLLDRSITETTKLSKIAATAVTNTVEPLKTRLESNVDAFVKPFFG